MADAFVPPPGWSQQDIDRFIGISYRNLVIRAINGEVDAATALADLDRYYMNSSITWPMPTLAIRDDEEWLTAEEIARECSVAVATVYVWADRGRWARVKKDRTRYRWGDVKAYRARARQLRAAKHPTRQGDTHGR